MALIPAVVQPIIPYQAQLNQLNQVAAAAGTVYRAGLTAAQIYRGTARILRAGQGPAMSIESRFNKWYRGDRKYGTSKKRARNYAGFLKRQRGFVRTGGNYGRYNPGGGTGARFQELKFLDLTVDDAVIATGGTIASNTVNIIAQGTTQSERIGRKVIIKKILWKLSLELPNSGSISAGTDTVRIILYQDLQCNGAAAVVTDILQSADVHSFRALDNSHRFRILMDKTQAINASYGAGNGTANDTGNVIRFWKFYKACAIPIEYSSTTGALTEIRSNNIGVLTISEKGLVGLSSFMRLRFEG